MRRARIVLVTLLALGAGFVAPASAGQDDGTMTVEGAEGFVSVIGSGVVIGRVDYGRVQIADPNPNDGSGLQLPKCPDRQNISAKTADPDDKVLVCTGEDIRFRLVGGTFRVTIGKDGTGINLSVAGKAKVILAGKVTEVANERFTTGVYTVNDSDPAPMPEHRAFQLDASATTHPATTTP